METFESAWDAIDWTAVDASTQIATTRENGEFSFEGTVEQDSRAGSVLWVLADGFVAQPTLLEPGAGRRHDPWIVTLRSNEGFHVRVVDSNDAPAPGARLRQFARPPKDRRINQRELAAYQVFHQELPLDRDARAEAPCMPSLAIFCAAQDPMCARPVWVTAESDRDVTLRLLETFDLVGRVRITDNTPREGAIVAVVSGVGGGASYRMITQTTVGLDLEFGPMQVALGSEESFMVSIDGGGLASERLRIDRPKPRERVEVVLETGIGHRQVVKVLDAQERGIEGADVTYSWWNANKSGSGTRAKTDSDGVAMVHGILAGSVWISVDAVGYVPQSLGPVEQPLPDGEAVSFTLEPGSKLRGRCVHKGKPLEDFDVVWWPEVAIQKQVKSFEKRRDGTFEIDGIPQGPIFVLACTGDLPQSRVLRIDPAALPPEGILLELPDPMLGRGQIVDAETNEPLPEAKVQLWAHFGEMTVARRGLTRPVDANGRFSFQAFAAGESILDASAPGYSGREVKAHAAEGETVEFGSIGLTRHGTWTIRLVGATSAIAQAATITLNGPHAVPLVHFDASGTAVIEGIGPGAWWATLALDNGELIFFNKVLQPATKWHLDVPIGSNRTLEVRVLPAAGATLPVDLNVSCKVRSELGDSIARNALTDEGGVARFDGVCSDEVVIEAYNGAAMIAGRAVRLTGDATKVDLELSGRLVRGRVVSKDGKSLQGSRLFASDGGGGFWEFAANCDAAGVCELALPELDPIFVRALHPDLGEGAARQLTADERRKGEFEIVLDPRTRLEVLAIERGVARAGTRFDVFDGTGRQFLSTIDADSTGIARRAQIETGNCVVIVASPGVWRELFVVVTTDPPRPQPVEVRSLGTLEFTLLDEHEVPVPGQELVVRCTDLDANVSDWIAAERVPAPADGMRTDMSGRLRITGLPRGKYVAFAKGSGSDVPCEVVGGTTRSVTVRLP